MNLALFLRYVWFRKFESIGFEKVLEVFTEESVRTMYFGEPFFARHGKSKILFSSTFFLS